MRVYNQRAITLIAYNVLWNTQSLTFGDWRDLNSNQSVNCITISYGNPMMEHIHVYIYPRVFKRILAEWMSFAKIPLSRSNVCCKWYMMSCILLEACNDSNKWICEKWERLYILLEDGQFSNLFCMYTKSPSTYTRLIFLKTYWDLMEIAYFVKTDSLLSGTNLAISR